MPLGRRQRVATVGIAAVATALVPRRMLLVELLVHPGEQRQQLRDGQRVEQ